MANVGNNIGFKLRKTYSSKDPHDIILVLLVDAIGLAIMVGIAGTSDKVANVVIFFMIGIFLLWLIMHSGQVTFISNLIGRIEGAAK